MRKKIIKYVGNFKNVVNEIEDMFGFLIVNRRVVLIFIFFLIFFYLYEDFIKVVIVIDDIVKEFEVDLIGGYFVVVYKNYDENIRKFIFFILDVLVLIDRLCFLVDVGIIRLGINFDVIVYFGFIIKEIV